jgi:isoleucyl-tRNA synthetase
MDESATLCLSIDLTFVTSVTLVQSLGFGISLSELLLVNPRGFVAQTEETGRYVRLVPQTCSGKALFVTECPPPALSPADLKASIFLPKTSFQLRGNLATREPETLAFWQKIHLEEKRRAARLGADLFLLHDGPPYANGHIHIGHAINKLFKDTINRMRFMQGLDVHYIPGWDCHGLPIEAKVEEAYRGEGISKGDVPPLEFRAACRVFAQKWIDVQKEEFQRLGIGGDWDALYTTMSPAEETGIVAAFLKIFETGDVYRGVKPVLWSVVEETALAEAEVEYKDVTSQAIDVAFKITHSPHPDLVGAQAVIWTTTPWTLPANRAIAYSPELSYTLMEAEERPGTLFLVADACVEALCQRAGFQTYRRVRSFEGALLEGTIASHPLQGRGYDFPVPLLPGAHVTGDAGTGLVHTAPSHGPEDFQVGLNHGLEIPEWVLGNGLFADAVPLFAGVHVYKAAPPIIAALKDSQALLSQASLTHSYPHSWRSKTPLIYRATPQWFIAMDGHTRLKETALRAIGEVTWMPEGSRNRIAQMVANRPDWCLSRQRMWGVPLPLFLHRQTGEVLRDARVNARILDLMKAQGADVWWSHSTEDFLSPFHAPDDFEKATDILDVWFDSGVTHQFVLKERGLPVPADLYFEGSDQHRGWFQSSLLTSCLLNGKAPYKAVFTHGFVVDEAGRKMSKSQGNVVSPQEITASKGSDILRLWGLSSDFEGDVRVGPGLLKHVEDVYRRLRNTFRFLLGALADFTQDSGVPLAEMPELERALRHHLLGLQQRTYEAFEAYRFQAALQDIHTFCATELSAFYLDIRKDVLYCDGPQSLERRATQTVLKDLLWTLVHLLAPLLPFTCEEVWQFMRSELKEAYGDLPPSVHLSRFPTPELSWAHSALAEHHALLRRIRQVVTGALEQARAGKHIGSSLEAHAQIHLGPPSPETLDPGILKLLCLTSSLSITLESPPPEAFCLPEVPGVWVTITKAEGGKCGRCWMIVPEVTEPSPICHRCTRALSERALQGQVS